MYKRLCLCVMLLGVCPALAATDLSAAEEQRYLSLLKELRCLVCQNQSLAESGAGLASDLRAAVRRMIAEGASDEEIKLFASERYGDFILYEPRFKPQTYALWLAPFAVLLIALAVLFRRIAKQQREG